MSNPTVSVATEHSSATPIEEGRSRRLKLVVASALALSGPGRVRGDRLGPGM